MTQQAFEIALIGELAGQNVANVLNYYTDMTGTDPTLYLEDLATAFQANVTALFLACCPADYSLICAQIRASMPLISTPTYIFLGASGPGTRTGNTATSSLGPVLNFPALAAPNARTMAKVYLPGISEADLNENTYTTDLQNAMINLIAILLGTLTGTNMWTYCCVSKKTNTIYDVAMGTPSNKIALQRRRMLPVGG